MTLSVATKSCMTVATKNFLPIGWRKNSLASFSSLAFSSLASSSFVFSSLLISIPATIAAPEDPASAPSNIFSSASPASTPEIPRFVKRGAGNDRREMNRRMMGERDGIPGWQELKILPSLNAVQRKKIHDIYEESKKDAGPLQAELKEMRAPRPEGIPQRTGNLSLQSSPNSDLNQNARGVLLRGQQRDLSANRPGPNMNPEKIARFNELRNELKAKRDQSWEKVKALLTEENLSDLELMRKGELLPEGLKADSRGPITSSFDKQEQVDYKPAGSQRIQGENQRENQRESQRGSQSELDQETMMQQ